MADNFEYIENVLQQKADHFGVHLDSEEFSCRMDAEDNLRDFRGLFYYPQMKAIAQANPEVEESDEPCIYMTGQSLGLQPKDAQSHVNTVMDQWAKLGVDSYHYGEMPSVLAADWLRDDMAHLVGALPQEVIMMNGLTVNIHIFLTSFYRPTPSKHKVLVEHNPFVSDMCALESQIRLHGYDPAESIIVIEPREGEEILRTKDIVDKIEKEGDGTALIFMSGVHYATGQVFDMKAIAKAGNSKGCHVGFDLAHAVGNIELHLHDWDIDFACWCSYKYLNGGPGAIAGAYLHEKHTDSKLPRLEGWWGIDIQERLKFNNRLQFSPGVAGYQLTNPSPFLSCGLHASLKIFKAATMKEMRAKSKLLTGYLEYLLLKRFCGHCAKDGKRNTVTPKVIMITPRDPEQRGCQLSMRMTMIHAEILGLLLKKRGVMCDIRSPNIIRLAPCPLYNTFEEVRRLVDILKECVDESLRIANRPRANSKCANICITDHIQAMNIKCAVQNGYGKIQPDPSKPKEYD